MRWSVIAEALRAVAEVPFPSPVVLGPAPGVRQVVLEGERELLARAAPRDVVEPRSVRAARTLLAYRSEPLTDVEPLPIETLLVLAPTEAFQLRQLLSVRPLLARGDDDAWDRVDQAILAQRGLEAASVVATRVRSARWVRDASLVPRMLEATRAEATRDAARAWLVRYADLAVAWGVRVVLAKAERASGEQATSRAAWRALALVRWLVVDAPELAGKSLDRLPTEARVSLAPSLALPFVPGLAPSTPPPLPPFVEEARRAVPKLALDQGSISIDDALHALVFGALFSDAAVGHDALTSALHASLTSSARLGLVRALVSAYRGATPRDTAAVDRPFFAAVSTLGRGDVGSGGSASGALGRLHRSLTSKRDPRASLALDVLGDLGDDRAVFELARVLEDARGEGARERARGLLEPLAAARAASVEEIVLRTLPSLDLDARGVRRLDDGTELALTSSLTVIVREGEASAPSTKRSPHDDERRELEVDVKALASRVARRFERWMCDAQVLSAEDLAPFLDHPVALRVASALVWEELDEAGAPVSRFRIAEDGSAATIDDALRAIPSRARVAHPVSMHEREAAQWAELLASYELMQPFLQTTRPHHRDRLARETGDTRRARQYATKVHTLVGRGFRLEPDGSELRKPLAGGVTLVVSLSPHFELRGDARAQGELDFELSAEGPTHAPVALHTLPLAVQSELLELFPVGL